MSKPTDTLKKQPPKNQLSNWDRTCELHHVFSKKFSFAPTPMTALLQQTLNKQPLSAVQPVFAESPWRKERLTHSQPRKKPRHRKETQSSWMKANPTSPTRIQTQNRFFFLSFFFPIDAEHTPSTKKRRVGGTSRHKPCATRLSIGSTYLKETRIGKQWAENTFLSSGCETIDDTFAGIRTRQLH